MTTTITGATGINRVADGADMPAGSVIQVVTAQINTGMISTTSSSWVIASGITASITPSYTSSRIFIMMHMGMGIGYGGYELHTTLARGSTIIGSSTYGNYAAVHGTVSGAALYHPYTLMHTDSPSTTSSTDYNLYFKTNTVGNPVYANHSGSVANITLMEIAG